jgi:hypothetical protein
MLADVKAYDAEARLQAGEDELIPLEISERRLRGEPALRIWREHRKLTQEKLAKKAKVSRALRRLRPTAKLDRSAHGRSWALPSR